METGLGGLQGAAKSLTAAEARLDAALERALDLQMDAADTSDDGAQGYAEHMAASAGRQCH